MLIDWIVYYVQCGWLWFVYGIEVVWAYGIAYIPYAIRWATPFVDCYLLARMGSMRSLLTRFL